MQLEEFDFAIYGSGVDAAFLAAELVRRHSCRIILIRDHVNDYTLPHHQDFSVGGNCDPATIEMVQHGLKNWQSQFAGSAGRACFSRGALSLKVSSPKNADLLHYIEGALIASDRQSERRASRDGTEYLHLRDVLVPNRREALEFLHSTYVGVGMEVFDRSHFQNAKRSKDGRLTLKEGENRFSAKQTIILDDDLLDVHSNATIRSTLCQTTGTKMALHPPARYKSPPVYCVDSQMHVRLQSNNRLLISAPLSFGDLTHFGKSEVRDLEKLTMSAQGAYEAVSTVDGSPILEHNKSKMTWIFSANTVRTFLMSSVSDIIAGGASAYTKKYWTRRGSRGRSFADIPAPINSTEVG